MNICYLNNQYPKVSHTFIRREIQALESLGVSVLRVCARQNSEGLVDQADIDEAALTVSIAQGKIPVVLATTFVTFITSPIVFFKALAKSISIGINDRIQIHKYFIYLAEACYLLKLCRQHQIEHIHAHFGTNPAAVALLCRLLGGPTYSFTVHGPEEFDRPESLSLSDKIHHAEFIVAISYFCQSQLYRWTYTLDEWRKINIVRCALGDESFDNTIPIAEDNRQLLAIGRLCEQKGFPLLMDAASRLHSKGVNFQLNIVGDGPMRSDMERAIIEYGLQECVTLLGYKSGDDVVRLIDNSRCLVVPSFAEGLPVVVMEALARKRPVLTTQIAAMSELVEQSVNGWIVPPGSLDALVKGMEKVLSTPVIELNAMGGAGWSKVKTQHNARQEAQKLLGHFQLASDKVAESKRYV